MRRILFCCVLAVAGLLIGPLSSRSTAWAWQRQMPIFSGVSPTDTIVLGDSVRAVARLLRANGAPGERADVVARALVKYAGRHALDLFLVVGVIGVENPRLESRAHSGAGAVGIMQVMPLWKRAIRGCGEDLLDVDVNVCFGTRILRLALDGSRSLAGALRRYNGCSRTPRCERYVSAVYSRAGQALLLSRSAPE